MYAEALAQCGTEMVITVDDTVVGIFKPIDLVGELMSTYKFTCLQDRWLPLFRTPGGKSVPTVK